MSFIDRIESSEYLNGLLQRHSDLLDFARGDQKVHVSLLQSIIDELDQCQAGQRGETTARSECLRDQKQRFSLLWAIAELSGCIDFVTLGRLQSSFAVHSIRTALDIAWYSPKVSKLFVQGDDITPQTSGVFILGLGKLGGFDLNFSSDIDLVAFYDKDKIQLAPMAGASYAVTECLKQLTSILSENTSSGFVWRVDWRLRPYASLRNLSMVNEKALEFYHYHARPWHRLAMIKARPVAGDLGLGEKFLEDLNSFMWRRSLDYRAIDDIAMLKAKINLEHPALAAQRVQDQVGLDDGRGMNLKLGHGGIREIEFIVNALQMLWGGRKPALRITNTLAALKVLAEEGLIEPNDADALQRAYRFLRRAENRLQMQANAQVYHLPVKPEALRAFLTLCGAADWVTFNQSLSKHRGAVHVLFESHFSGPASQSINQNQVLTLSTADLSEPARQVAQDWDHGFSCYGLEPGQARQFESLLTALTQEVERSGCDISESILQIDDYFRRLPPGGQYFRLLRDFPWLLEKIIAPLLLSSAMTSLLQQSPHIIDRFLEHSHLDSTQLDTTIVFSNSDYEYRLENLRRLANEELYLLYIHYFETSIAPSSFQKQLTRLAELLLTASIRVACDEMNLDESPIAVIGFGKLGSQGMMPKSDLDLVYLCDSMQGHGLASQFASRLNTIINTPMREGRVYELDTRLRPSGQSGSVTISLSSYRQHQFERAHSWSHLALVPARFVTGETRVGQQFAEIKQAILSRPRDIRQFKYDCAKMLKRVQDQRIKVAGADQFTVKLRPGGLFELEYLINCLAIPACIDRPELAGVEFATLLDALDKQYPGLTVALECLQSMQLEIRLFGRDDAVFESLPDAVRAHLLKVMLCDSIDELIEKVQAAIDFTDSLHKEFFDGVDWDALSTWKETRVEWL